MPPRNVRRVAAARPGAADLGSFLPRAILPLLPEAVRGHEPMRRFPATILFCDVAGFTPLTEALAAIGREGAEELTRVLNGYFDATIGLLAALGGDVLRFGGDAMTVAFPGRSAARACRAAIDVMDAMQAFQSFPTRAGTFSLAMKVGIAHGDLQVGLVGDTAVGWDYYAAGAPVDASADAEHHATPGMIVLHPTVPLPPGGQVTELGGGFRRLDAAPSVRALRLRSGQAVAADAPVRPPDATLRKLLPAHLLALAASRAPGEHRGTAVVFAAFAGLRNDPRRLHAGVSRAFRSLASIAARYGGIVNKVDMGDKGAKAILLFGAPRAIERREEMAVRAAMDLLADPELRGLEFRIGVSSAPLFSGPVGSRTRREFTVMGDGINVAARLMQAAPPGTILCTEACAGAAATGLRFVAHAPITVKGKRDPLPVFSPTAEVVEHAVSEELVERDDLMQALQRYLVEGGRVFALAAPAGLGKTAVLDRLASSAAHAGWTVSRTELAPYHAERFLSAWQTPVQDALDLGSCRGEEGVRNARDRALADEDPGHRPLLNPLLGLPTEETRALRNLSPRERRDLSVALVARLVTRGGKRLLVLDGLQWADPASLDVLERVTDEAAGAAWRVAVAFRPDARLDPLRLQPVPLPALTAAGVEQLLVRVHGFVDVLPPVRQWFFERSRGVPAVLAALLAAVGDAGLVRRDAQGASIDQDRLSRTAFPDTLEGLYLARVETLPATEREVLESASILGTAVSENLLASIVAQPAAGRRIAGRRDLRADLLALCRGGLLAVDTWKARPYYRFVDTLLRDAVYNALPYARRRDGHRRVAEVLEREDADTPRVWPALAHHFEQGGDTAKARKFARLAGRDAAARFDNVAAMRHLEVACRALSPSPDDVDDAILLIHTYEHLGRWADALPVLERLQAFQEALDASRRSRIASFEGTAAAFRQDWDAARAALTRSLSLAQASGSQALVASAYVNLAGEVYGPTGDLRAAREALERALDLSEDPQRPWRPMALLNLAMVRLLQGHPADALRHLERAHKEARHRRLGPVTATIADHLSGVYGELGRLADCLRLARESVRVLDTFSQRGKLANAQSNLAQALMTMGRTDEAIRLFQAVLRRAADQGDVGLRGRARRQLAEARLLRGELTAALEDSRQAFEDLQASRNVRDAAACVGIMTTFQALGARAEFLVHWKDLGISESSSLDPQLAGVVERFALWVRGDAPWGEDPADFLASASRFPAEERLERLLWVCEWAIELRDLPTARRHQVVLTRALARWPSHVGKVRVLRVQSSWLSTRDLGVQAVRLLSIGPAGIWGLRLLCTLALWPTPPRGAQRLARERLATFKAGSPAWAWERLARLPEVRAYLLRYLDETR